MWVNLASKCWQALWRIGDLVTIDRVPRFHDPASLPSWSLGPPKLVADLNGHNPGQEVENRSGYGSIPINTIFRGMNIHLPAILMFTRGIGFWPIPISVFDGFWLLWTEASTGLLRRKRPSPLTTLFLLLGCLRSCLQQGHSSWKVWRWISWDVGCCGTLYHHQLVPWSGGHGHSGIIQHSHLQHWIF